MKYPKFSTTPTTTHRPRLNASSFRKIPVGGCVTVRNGYAAEYETGFQVCVMVYPFATVEEVSRFLHTVGRKGQYTVRHSQNLWFVDENRQVPTKKAALALARSHNRQSIYDWAKGKIIRC